jgi:hypothetical protein
MKTVWRVQLAYGEDPGFYKRGSKTYMNYAHALSSYNDFKRRGFKVSLLKATLSDWEDATPVDNPARV